MTLSLRSMKRQAPTDTSELVVRPARRCFSSRCFLFKVGEDVGEGAASCLGVELADFAADADLAFCTKHFLQLFEQLDEAVGALVDNHRALLISKCFYGRLTSFLVWQEAEEDEAVARQAAVDERRHEGCGARQTLHLDAFLHGFAHQQESRVADAGGAGVGDDGDSGACLQAFDEARHRLVLVEDVVALQRCLDAVVLQEHAAGAGVFGQDEVDRAENLDSTISHVAEVPYRCRYKK